MSVRAALVLTQGWSSCNRVQVCQGRSSDTKGVPTGVGRVEICCVARPLRVRPAAVLSAADPRTPFNDYRRTAMSATTGTGTGLLIGAILAFGVRDAVPGLTLTVIGG